MEHNLQTKEGRIAAIKEIETSFVTDLKSVIHTCKNVHVRIQPSLISIGVTDTDKTSKFYNQSLFGSEVTIYPDKISFNGRQEHATLSYGCSGSFDLSDTASYWKTVHAANIIQNWSKVISLVNNYCNAIKTLEEKIFSTNKPLV